jgi:hypothetical protein
MASVCLGKLQGSKPSAICLGCQALGGCAWICQLLSAMMCFRHESAFPDGLVHRGGLAGLQAANGVPQQVQGRFGGAQALQSNIQQLGQYQGRQAAGALAANGVLNSNAAAAAMAAGALGASLGINNPALTSIRPQQAVDRGAATLGGLGAAGQAGLAGLQGFGANKPTALAAALAAREQAAALGLQGINRPAGVPGVPGQQAQGPIQIRNTVGLQQLGLGAGGAGAPGAGQPSQDLLSLLSRQQKQVGFVLLDHACAPVSDQSGSSQPCPEYIC